jgi:hypothetical protein
LFDGIWTISPISCEDIILISGYIELNTKNERIFFDSLILILKVNSVIVTLLIVLCLDFEVSLWVCAYWAYLWSLLADYDVTAV